MGFWSRLLGRGGDRANPFSHEAMIGGAAAPREAGGGSAKRGRRTLADLERLVGLSAAEMRKLRGRYHTFGVPKRTGGVRKIEAPDAELKRLQRVILRRVLSRLRAHDAAMGFERGRSSVTHARVHERKAVVVRIDVKDFFGSIPERRVRDYFLAVGWDKAAAGLLAELCTYKGALPQGAPTSPRLANLVSYRMDARLAGLAARRGAAYTRYADDITYSFEVDDGHQVRVLVGLTAAVLEDCGLRMHMKKKLRIRRRHQQQLVTGLVVNDGVRLPRRTRRWLRAVEHRVSMGGAATLTPTQLEGWRAFASSVEPPRT